jgi:hypothetical protein
MLGLDKTPGTHRPPTNRDYRWRDRLQEWNRAELARVQLANYDTPQQRDFLVTMAKTGHFAIWWTVFDGDPDMRQRLRKAFIGTHSGCFDPNEGLQQRVGGQL